jgi:hypothetical protein
LLNAFQRQVPISVFQGLPGIDLLRLVLLSLAAAIAITLGVSFLFEANVANETAAPSSAVASVAPEEPLRASRQKIEAQIDDAPDYARFFDRMKTVLPIEYDAILDKFAKQSLAGSDINLDSLVSEAVRDVRLSNGILAAKADGPTLAHIFDMQLQMMQALANKDPRLCVDFLYGGASEAFFQFSAENRRLVSDMAIAGLDAIENGRVNRIERPPPSDADFNELETAMKAQGLNPAEIAAILDGKTPDPPIADERMCTVGQIYLKTLAALPEPERLRIYGLAVELMARS